MKIFCLLDAAGKSSLSMDLVKRIEAVTRKEGHSLEVLDLYEGDLAYCTGCLRCWSSESTECVTKDRLPEIEMRLSGCGLLLFLVPVRFGTFSSTIKIAVDKGLGNKLHEEKPGKRYPRLFIGFGEDTSDEETRCFTDIIEKHMGKADIVHPELSEMPADVMVTRSLVDNEEICSRIVRMYLRGEK
ncbi:MAG: flavodoxin family protein [Spirochaetes bacterium]|nr:flavodoxin family protein [Spirochaetota bacterium]